MRVDEFMTTRIESIDADRSVYDALEKMVDRRIRSLMVNFEGSETEHGVVTARDIVFNVLAIGRDPRDVQIAEVTSRPLLCVSRGADVREAAAIMGEKKVARVFVCEGKKVVGVLALIDLMAAELIMLARGEHVS